MIEASIICDSIAEHSLRLTTFLTRYPKFIHAEHMRHRALYGEAIAPLLEGYR